MNPTQRTAELRLHVCENQIWFSGQDPAQASDLSAKEFVCQAWVLEAETISIPGTRDNAELICELHSRRSLAPDGRPKNIQVANPILVPTEHSGGKQVRQSFSRMSTCTYAGTQGGSHALTCRDYVTYALIGVLNKSGGKYNNLAEKLLRAHPAWPVLSFLKDTNKEAACHLLTTIIDPRWYINPMTIKLLGGEIRMARLKQFFGLAQHAEREIAKIVHGESDLSEPTERAKLVLDTWTGGEYTPPPQDVVGPRQFLWRAVNMAKPAGYLALVKGCHVFLRLLRDVWLANVYDKGGYRPELFIPRYFFDLKTEAVAWEEHMIGLKKKPQ